MIKVRVHVHDLPSAGAQRRVWARDINWQGDSCRPFMWAEHNGCVSECARVSEAVSSLEPERFGMVTAARDGDDLEGVTVSSALNVDLE